MLTGCSHSAFIRGLEKSLPPASTVFNSWHEERQNTALGLATGYLGNRHTHAKNHTTEFARENPMMEEVRYTLALQCSEGFRMDCLYMAFLASS